MGSGALYEEWRMNSEVLHSRLRRSQLVQMGFFSSQRVCRDLHVELCAQVNG